MHPFRSTVLRAALLIFLVLSSSSILYTTFQNTRSANELSDQALEGTATALAATLEAELRSGDSLAADHVRRILSDRVVDYALVSDIKGRVLFHTNPGLIGIRLPGENLDPWLQTGKAYGRRITLRTGLPAYEFNYPLHLPEGRTEMLRLVIHTFPADQIISRAQGMWWTVGLVLLILWSLGILFDRLFARQFRLQKKLQRSEQLAVIGQMTSVLAHEIRNALGGIKGYTQWMDEKTADSDPNKSSLSLVLKGILRIESLVQDLLIFSRQETYHLELFAVDRIVREVVDRETFSGGITIETAVEEGLHVFADKEKLHRVLQNGIQNALQMTEDGQGLQIKALSKGGWVEIRIEDFGPGIPEEELPRLFTPFFTTRISGTGLGLAYSKKVIEGMGGEISLFNHPEHRGAVLNIKLPKGRRILK
jgi:two-component system, NtrC family, sensor histidine kinase HydH